MCAPIVYKLSQVIDVDDELNALQNIMPKKLQCYLFIRRRDLYQITIFHNSTVSTLSLQYYFTYNIHTHTSVLYMFTVHVYSTCIHVHVHRAD